MLTATKITIAPCKLLINGEWTDSADGKSFESKNPATGEVTHAGRATPVART